MIKELGTLGFFIKFNESASTSLKFIEVFSSSALSTSLFSASTNSSKTVAVSTTASMFLNGSYASAVYDDQWAHLTFIFDPKLKTSSSSNFIVRFGNTTKANFQIQNIYILDNLLDQVNINYIHNAFTGNVSYISGGDTASFSIKVIDKDEALHTSSLTAVVYQPYTDQNKFLTDVVAVTASSASSYLTTALTKSAQFFDGVKVITGDKILSTLDNKVYQVQSDSKLLEISSITGNYVHVLDGIKFGGYNFIKTSSGFIKAPFLEKVVYLESTRE